jgi:hypothetical protein
LDQCLDLGVAWYRQLESDEAIGVGGRQPVFGLWLGGVCLVPPAMAIPVDIQKTEVFAPGLSLGDKGLVDLERTHVADSVPGLEDEVDGGAGSGDFLILGKVIIRQEQDEVGILAQAPGYSLKIIPFVL